jgi:hypothetical protein
VNYIKNVNNNFTSYIIKYNLTCMFIKFFVSHFVTTIVMHALHENTCVYEVQVESIFRDLLKCYILVQSFYKWHAYMYKGWIIDN